MRESPLLSAFLRRLTLAQREGRRFSEWSSKANADARNLFHKSVEIAGKRPRLLITDGLQSYRDAFDKEYKGFRHSGAIHIRDISMDGDIKSGRIHNNKMERMNGEIRDREKTFRGLKKTDSPFFKGLQIYHNYIRPHEGLNGDTPADRAGIKVEGQNKWLTIIQNASHVDAHRQSELKGQLRRVLPE